MSTFDSEKFRRACQAAAHAALDANVGDDGGTCNFDTAVVHLPADLEPSIVAAVEGTGITVNSREWMCERGELAYFLRADTYGQGAARTRSAEAIQRVMAEHGFKGLTYYQVD